MVVLNPLYHAHRVHIELTYIIVNSFGGSHEKMKIRENEKSNTGRIRFRRGSLRGRGPRNTCQNTSKIKTKDGPPYRPTPSAFFWGLFHTKRVTFLSRFFV